MNTLSKRCRKRHAYTGTYCQTCKRNRERSRYWNDPDAQRERKRNAYRKEHPYAHTRVVREAVPPMNESATQVEEEECGHDIARLTEAPDGRKLYYCFNCDTWVDPETGEPTTVAEDDGDPNSGKAQAPTVSQNVVGALPKNAQPTKPPNKSAATQERGRRQERDQAKMVTVQCSHTDPTGKRCQMEFKVWPQNLALVQYCPQLHRTQHKRELNKKRQADFRNRHSPRNP